MIHKCLTIDFIIQVVMRWNKVSQQHCWGSEGHNTKNRQTRVKKTSNQSRPKLSNWHRTGPSFDSASIDQTRKEWLCHFWKHNIYMYISFQSSTTKYCGVAQRTSKTEYWITTMEFGSRSIIGYRHSLNAKVSVFKCEMFGLTTICVSSWRKALKLLFY